MCVSWSRVVGAVRSVRAHVGEPRHRGVRLIPHEALGVSAQQVGLVVHRPVVSPGLAAVTVEERVGLLSLLYGFHHRKPSVPTGRYGLAVVAVGVLATEVGSVSGLLETGRYGVRLVDRCAKILVGTGGFRKPRVV